MAYRGTQGTVWALAHFNETVLGNKSIIVARYPATYRDHDTTDDSIAHFTQRFETFFVSPHDVNRFLIEKAVDVAYVPTQGLAREASDIPTGVPTITHCVFENGNKGGTIQTAISPFVAKNVCRVLPNPIHVDLENTDDMRKTLGIPEDAIVFGRYGGYDTFNIKYTHDVICKYATEHPNTYFLFMNTRVFTPSNASFPNIIFLPPSRDVVVKSRFIRTCDAMLHARIDGESFGMAVGEFAVFKKPILTTTSGATAHLHYLQEHAILFYDASSLATALSNFQRGTIVPKTLYDEYLAEKVIIEFEQLIKEAHTIYHGKIGL